MNTRTIRQGLLRTIGNLFLGRLIEVLVKTLHIEFHNQQVLDNLERNGEHFILAFWHGTMLLPWHVFKDKKYMGLTSQSKDGNVLAKLLSRWNYVVTRGSSSQGGKVALAIMIDFAKYEGSVMVTPDGPRGPGMKFKAGAVVASQRSESPLVLLGVGYEKKWQLRSWDKFQIPKPFSKVRLVFSQPVRVNKMAQRDEVSMAIEQCDSDLNALQKEAEQLCK